MRATKRLVDSGFEAYLVGGCVRDLLLGRTPKDYDIATAARPPQVKRTFPRNCRIIGRRFKLAHLHFHGNTKILECSTFRRTPQLDNNGDEDLLITRDNEFGNAEEDALRRDFTVNALFFDPTRDVIVDHVDGLRDLEARVIRTIGDPRVRFREDPVRILRAAKFAGRLGFAIEPETLAAMAETAGDLVRAAPPRLLEEILRLLRSGHALDSFQLLRDVGALKSLLPVVADFLAAARHDQRVAFWRLLEALDRRIAGGDAPPNGVLLAVVTYGAVEAAAEQAPARSPSSIAEDLLGPLAVELRLPRRDSGCMKRICGVQHRFAQDDNSRRFRLEAFLAGPYFAEAFQLFELRAMAGQFDTALVESWRELGAGAIESGFAPDATVAAAADADPDQADRGSESAAADGHTSEAADDAPRRRRRRRSRRGRSGAPAAGDRPGGHSFDQLAGSGEDGAWAAAGDVADVDGDAAPAPPERGAEEGDRGAAAGDDEPVDLQALEAPGAAQVADHRPGRRRRRRRRRRGGNRAHDAVLEPDDGGARPHGDPFQQLDADSGAMLPEGTVAADGDAPSFPADPGAPGKGQSRRGRRRRRRCGRPDDQPAQRPAAQPRRGDRGGRSGPSHPRDVAVVPRHHDRRGKIEVIEPVSLDLSAFDVELDPKRVPTFGSIVEGKSRPKRRAPRPPADGGDDYRPPPPPGGAPGPEAPPLPADDDSFGDW